MGGGCLQGLCGHTGLPDSRHTRHLRGCVLRPLFCCCHTEAVKTRRRLSPQGRWAESVGQVKSKTGPRAEGEGRVLRGTPDRTLAPGSPATWEKLGEDTPFLCSPPRGGVPAEIDSALTAQAADGTPVSPPGWVAWPTAADGACGGKRGLAAQNRLSPPTPSLPLPQPSQPHGREDTAGPGFYKTSLFTF